MKRSLLVFSIVAIWASTYAFAQSSPSGSVFQSWNEVQLVLPLVRSKDAKGKSVDRLTATFSGVLRLGRKDIDAVDRRTGLTLDFRANKYVTLVSGVLYRKEELIKNSPHIETRLDLGVILSKTWHEFTFKDRNMYEHRYRNGRADTNLYRQRIHISHPVRRKDKVLFSPFISEEGYYNIGAGSWVQNEFYAGISRKINRQTSLEAAYVRKDSKPYNVNGLFLRYKIALR